ncbi:uncharacterized protein LOC120075393 [Benincasa hispida]|uniref:uncharacterized protein LOC120075393 n=1 Tax=Benincasa hispida TaxID=102211 RepID=UPI0019029145|nr:uncharacterized protein LOC120075393 [Benincasa hispida]XP_038884676.1 uncharacterized protein LOC120075393 [Benincasa hispida]
MQCRRGDDFYVRESENMELHAQDRLHLDHGRYGKPRREALDRAPRLRRSLSAHRIGGSRGEVGLLHRVDVSERRNGDWHLRTGRNNEIGSSSHSYGQARKMPNYKEVFLHNDHGQLSDLQQTHVLPEPRKFSADNKVVNYKHDVRYRHDDLRIRKEMEIIEGRWSDGRGQRMMGQKLLAMEEGTAMGLYNSHLDIGPKSVYKDFLPSSQSLDVRSHDNERLKFQNHVVSDKPQVTDSREVEESQRFNSRNIGYSASSGFYSRGNESSLSGPLTSKCLESYRDGHYFQISDEFSTRSHGDLVDPIEFNPYGKRTLVDSAIDLVSGKRNLTPHQRGTNSPRREHESYFYSKPERTVNISNEDPCRVMQKTTQTHDYVDYDGTIVSDPGDFSRPKVTNTSMLKLQNADDLCVNYRTGIALDHYWLRKQAVLDYPDIGPSTEAINNDNEYAGEGSIHVDVGRRVTQDYERSHINLSQYCQTSYARSDYGSEREVGSYCLKERLHRSSMSKCDGVAYRNTERVQRMTEGVHTYNLREGHVPKRKYFEEDMNLLDDRIATSCEDTPSKVVDLYDNGEQWMDDENSCRYISRKEEFDHNKYKKPNTKFNRQSLYASADSHESYLDHVKKYKPGPKYMKGNRRHGPSSWIKSQNVGHRNSSHRPVKNWKKTEENDYACVNDDDLSDDLVISTESEPPEDSEEFKQLTHEAFLKCSKMLNMKSSVRKKYTEQGNAGSLYCIICRRSHSKEFMNTQRLVKHAYMSHKVGLRALHLGLAKAICVLMGWNSVRPQDTVTWVPEVLSKEEIVVQKEDLIIWPPVIIVRNLSLSYSSPDKWRVVTIKALESFLRSKNLLKGRVKMNLGCPADQSVMVLKFLPTFSGLTDAERLDKFFSENRRGREDFELAKCKKGGVGMEGDKIEEEVLYGYLGTAEDLDDVELNVRKLSMIKSKKEILEL